MNKAALCQMFVVVPGMLPLCPFLDGNHITSVLLQIYIYIYMAEEGIPANWELRWCPRSLRKAVAFGPNTAILNGNRNN